jgi:SAM-dependent methyltransferase
VRSRRRATGCPPRERGTTASTRRSTSEKSHRSSRSSRTTRRPPAGCWSRFRATKAPPSRRSSRAPGCSSRESGSWKKERASSSVSDSQLRTTFDSVADRYDAARPSYPESLFDDLVELAQIKPGDRLLEIGCGTGKATRPLLERGFSIVALELGAQLAEQARRNLAGLPVDVRVAAFEEWESTETFDLVYAATAWHWIDPASRYRKARALLRPGGHLAFWSAGHAFPAGFDPFFSEIQEVYDAIGEPHLGEWPPPRPEQVPDDTVEIEATGLFDRVSTRRYVWESSYTAEGYIALLDTFSGHIAMAPAAREHLYGEIRTRIERRPEARIRRHWAAILHVARRARSKA